MLERQKLLNQIGAYAGKLDGWFGDTMKAAVELFQMHAEKGEFTDAAGNPVKLPEDGRLAKKPRGGVTVAIHESAKVTAAKKLKIKASSSGAVGDASNISLASIQAREESFINTYGTCDNATWSICCAPTAFFALTGVRYTDSKSLSSQLKSFWNIGDITDVQGNTFYFVAIPGYGTVIAHAGIAYQNQFYSRCDTRWAAAPLNNRVDPAIEAGGSPTILWPQ